MENNPEITNLVITSEHILPAPCGWTVRKAMRGGAGGGGGEGNSQGAGRKGELDAICIRGTR